MPYFSDLQHFRQSFFFFFFFWGGGGGGGGGVGGYRYTKRKIFAAIRIENVTFTFKKMHLTKMSSAK